MDLYKKIASLPPEKRELFEMMLMEQGVDLSQIMIVPQKRDTNRFPLSYSQQRLWFLDQLEPETALYNISPVLRLKGKLNFEALEKSFNEIIRRHEALRTTFDKDGDAPVQVIAPELNIKIEMIEPETANAILNDSEINRIALKESQIPFNLSTGPLLRVKLLRVAEEDHVLILTKHHIISDNWSTGLMVHEMMQLYSAFTQGQPSPLPELAVQYADFAFWQRKWLSGKTLENQAAYWREQLKDAPPVLDMPLDKPRPAYQTYNGSFKTFTLSGATHKALNELSRQQEATLFMTTLAAFQVLLMRWTGQEDFCIGSPIANRNRKETEAMLGVFINTLVLRSIVPGELPFKELLNNTKTMTLDAYAHQDIPFETLVEELKPERDMSHSPFFQAMFVMNNARVDKLELPGLELSLLEIDNKTTKFDLILNMTESDEGLLCKMEYNTDLFFPETIDRLIAQYRTLLEGILRNPESAVSRLPMLTEKEEQKLVTEWGQSHQSATAEVPVHILFERQAKQSPQADALKIKDETYSYSELNSRANQLARHLVKRRLQQGEIVGVCAERSAEMLIALLAVLKAGAVYLPLDPSYPEERLRYMLSDSGAGFLLTQEALKHKLSTENIETVLLDSDWETIQREETSNISVPIESGDTAYLIYTSGSTGQPKGVEAPHGAFAAHCVDMCQHYNLTDDDNVLQFAALNFDASLEQILPPLMSGSTLIMRDSEIWDTHTFSKNIAKYDLTVINPPTAYWAQLAADWVNEPELLPDNRIRLVIVGGDVLRPEALKHWYQTPLKNIRLLNAYGPTETIITASTFEVPPGFSAEKVPVGKPCANRIFYVLDKQKKPVAAGVPGELYIGGSALAKGYLGRETLTAERFIANPFVGEADARMYKTGDRVRFLNDGNLEFLGRVDFQVKIRGFRIELGEIEALLDSYESIKESVLSALDDSLGNKRLVAYYTAKEELSASEIRSFLEQRLPDYMVPSVFIYLKEMPLDPSGKINRRFLPAPDFSQVKVETEYVAPRTKTEEKLTAMVQEILKIEKAGVKDSFFDLGGHSMMATQVVSRIREEFDVEISLRTLFEKPTVEGIALSITEAQAEFQDSDELESMLSEIEDLSDEELEKLLNDK